MISAIKKPYIPSGKVCHAAVSGSDPELLKMLISLDIKPIITVDSGNLDKRVSSHSDMLVFVSENKNLYIDRSQKDNIDNFLTIGYNCRLLKNEVKSPYPDDCRLNTVLLGDKMFYNDKATDLQITESCNKSLELINVNQGYIKCSVCPVTDNAFITDDISICNAAKNNGFDVLLITKGSVELNGFDYGFIGGCTGLIDKNKLLFNGDIGLHEDCDRIIDFLLKHNVEPVIIKDKPLYDIGSIIPLTEYINVNTDYLA